MRRQWFVAALAAAAAIAAGCGATAATNPSGAGADEETLSLGTRAFSPFVEYGSGRESRPSRVGVRALRVRKGRIADLAEFDLTAAQRKGVPYYVDAEFENLGSVALSRNLLRASLEDETGREHRPATLVLIGGSFAKCPETPRKALQPGGRFTACSPILLPRGVDPGRVRFQGDVTEDPVRWAVRR